MLSVLKGCGKNVFSMWVQSLQTCAQLCVELSGLAIYTLRMLISTYLSAQLYVPFHRLITQIISPYNHWYMVSFTQNPQSLLLQRQRLKGY